MFECAVRFIHPFESPYRSETPGGDIPFQSNMAAGIARWTLNSQPNTESEKP